MCEWAPDTDRSGFWACAANESDMGWIAWSATATASQTARCGATNEGLRMITTHRSAYESLGGRSIARASVRCIGPAASGAHGHLTRHCHSECATHGGAHKFA